MLSGCYSNGKFHSPTWNEMAWWRRTRPRTLRWPPRRASAGRRTRPSLTSDCQGGSAPPYDAAAASYNTPPAGDSAPSRHGLSEYRIPEHGTSGHGRHLAEPIGRRTAMPPQRMSRRIPTRSRAADTTPEAVMTPATVTMPGPAVTWAAATTPDPRTTHRDRLTIRPIPRRHYLFDAQRNARDSRAYSANSEPTDRAAETTTPPQVRTTIHTIVRRSQPRPVRRRGMTTAATRRPTVTLRRPPAKPRTTSTPRPATPRRKTRPAVTTAKAIAA